MPSADSEDDFGITQDKDAARLPPDMRKLNIHIDNLYSLYLDYVEALRLEGIRLVQGIPESKRDALKITPQVSTKQAFADELAAMTDTQRATYIERLTQGYEHGKATWAKTLAQRVVRDASREPVR